VKYIVSIFCALATVLPVLSQEQADTVASDSVKPRAWLAAIENIGVTGFIVGYNNSVLSSSPFSKVTYESMKRNLTEFKWWWDEDFMYTNTIEHPYHGSIYYLTARENGLGMGTSALFSVGGSLIWELFGESERPAYNDMVTTPIGGVTLGEPLHRISQAIIDDRARGLERVGRELLATIVNPLCGINRLLRGDSWRVRGGYKRQHLLTSRLSAGYRYLSVSEMPNVASAYLHWNTTYGDVMGAEGNGLFDYFDLDFTAVAGGHQTLLNYARVTSQLWCGESVRREAETAADANGRKSSEHNWGFYNHFYYLYAEPDYAADDYYRKFRNCVGYSEVGSVGPGYAYRATTPKVTWEQKFFLNGILLGATPMKLVDRVHPKVGYTWGSGYGAKIYSRLQAGEWLKMGLDVDCSQLFTWLGYRCHNVDDLTRVRAADIQGEKGNALTFIAAPTVELWPCHRVGLEVRGRYVWHKFNYLYHQHTTLDSIELLAGLIVRL